MWVDTSSLPLLLCVHLLFCAAAAHQPSELSNRANGCLLVRDVLSEQDVRLEAHGDNAIRVRAVPSGGSFRDDLVSALVSPPPAHAFGICQETALTTEAQSLTNGNLEASIDQTGKLTFTRVSDRRLLLKETTVRTFTPITTNPPTLGFLALELTFNAVAEERIFLGQHTS